MIEKLQAAQIEWAHKHQQQIEFINNQLRLERKAETKFTELKDAMREYHEVFGHEFCINPIQYGLFLKHYSMPPPPCNFAVSQGRKTKFGKIRYFDVLSSKMALIFKFRASMTSL